MEVIYSSSDRDYDSRDEKTRKVESRGMKQQRARARHEQIVKTACRAGILSHLTL